MKRKSNEEREYKNGERTKQSHNKDSTDLSVDGHFRHKRFCVFKWYCDVTRGISSRPSAAEADYRQTSNIVHDHMLSQLPRQMPDGEIKVVVRRQPPLISTEIVGKLRILQQQRTWHQNVHQWPAKTTINPRIDSVSKNLHAVLNFSGWRESEE
jgi:hypothetical protein